MDYPNIILVILGVLTLIKGLFLLTNVNNTKKLCKKTKLSNNLISTYSVCMGILALLLLLVVFLITDPRLVLVVMFASFLLIKSIMSSSPTLFKGMQQLIVKEKNSWLQATSLISIVLALLTLYLALTI